MLVRSEIFDQNERIEEYLRRFNNREENPRYLKWIIEILFERIKELEERLE